MLICPGWCGAEFINSDTTLNQKDLAKHLLRCSKGHATVVLLQRFSEWLLRTAQMDLPNEPDIELVDYAKAVVTTFMEDDPTTDPRSYLARSWTR
jgi:hypothetical protein